MSIRLISNNYRLIFFLLALLSVEACEMTKHTITRDFALVDLLITQDDMPDGWQIEFPAGSYTGFYYPEEAVKIVFIPKSGTRRATGQSIYRFSTSDAADFKLHNEFIPEVLNSGEFIPSEWVHPKLSAAEDKFVCYWKAVDIDPEKFMLCVWTARYDEFIVTFSSWILPDLMNLDAVKSIIMRIDQKLVNQLQ